MAKAEEHKERKKEGSQTRLPVTAKRLKTTAQGFSPGLAAIRTALQGRPNVVSLTSAGPKTCSDVTRQPRLLGAATWPLIVLVLVVVLVLENAVLSSIDARLRVGSSKRHA